jgi:hypothetical protein
MIIRRPRAVSIGGTEENRGLIAHLGALDVDIPRSIGYFGGITLAVAFEVIEWPVGLFIASIPFVKMLNRPKLPQSVRFAEHVLDGMAKPVGGDSEGTIRTSAQGSSSQSPAAPQAGQQQKGKQPARRAASPRRPQSRARRPTTTRASRRSR